MTRTMFLGAKSLLAGLLSIVIATASLAQSPKLAPQAAEKWAELSDVPPVDLATTGENPYFVLLPGYQLVLEGMESGAAIRLVVTALELVSYSKK